MGDVRSLPLRRPLPGPLARAAEQCANCTVRSLTICAQLSADEQLRMGAMSTDVSLKPRQMLFQEGDDAEHVFNITSGSVSLSKALADGRRQITGFFGPGDFLGLNTKANYTVSAEALVETHVCRFPREPFQRLLADLPRLEHNLLVVAETEIATAQEQILLLGRKTAMERIASFLLIQRQRAAHRGQPVNPLVLPMTRAEVADFLGLTIETVSRCFTKLRKLDIISLPAADRVLIKQPERLHALSEAVH